ncbi:MAG: ATP-binding protein [Myxococcales bacterium]|nr:ATP-binding protein [Myxococcales bacterium]MDH3842985.1 ATP-binding protein [Myxococcales bacterium]
MRSVPRQHAFAEHIREKNLGGARVASVLGATLVPSGVVLDWLTSREHLASFVIIRLAAAAACLGFLALTRWSRAKQHAFALGVAPIIACSVALELMILDLGGYASPYYAGLVQVMLVVGLIFYWRVSQAILVCVFIVLIWLFPALAHIPDIIPGPFLNNLYALLITAVIAVTSNATRYRLAQREFAANSALAQTSEELAVALARAREVDQAKSEFFANVSHELRTPLTLILSPVDELLSKLRPSAERDALKVVRRNAERLLRMIDDLLDLARLEAGGLRLKVMQVDVGDLAQRVAENARPAARAKEVELAYSVEGEPPEMFGDPHRVEIILTNLVGNAMKFTPAGGRIEVRAIYNAAGTSIEVQDTGPGIPRDEQQRIFERFHQTETSERRQAGGVGIGLALARELAQLHGGSLTVDSEVGEGSTFTLFLKSGRDHFHSEIIERRQVHVDVHPGRRIEDRMTAPPTRPMQQATVEIRQSQRPSERVLLDRGRVPRVLVAEDEEDLRGFIVGVLSETYHVDAAKNGSEALELMKEHRPDLVLTDVMMPGTSGLDLCKAIKDDPSLRNIPVILLTARGESETALEGYEAGADDFVSKPFHTQVLLARIRAHLKMRGLSLQLADQARLASAGTLAAGLAHEVKNPLNAVVNAARVLQRGGSQRVPSEKLLGIMIDGLDRIDSILSALGAHARPADGTDLAPCNVQVAVQSTLNLLQHRMRDVTVHEDFEVTGNVLVPARAFNQVLLNLIDNSVRSGAKNIWLELQQHEKVISVTVSDDGPGVPHDMVHRIFDPFFTTRAEGEGTGLGLHLSRRIAQESGGELRYEPRPGGGARFVMEIPAMEQAA